MNSKISIYIILLCVFIMSCESNESKPITHNWSRYLGDNQSSQYSSLTQINTDNISSLKLAWQYDGGEAHPDNRSQIQCNPLAIDGVVYATTATLKVIALDGQTGEKIWTFDPYDGQFSNFGMGVNRGLMWYENQNENQNKKQNEN